MSKLWPKYENWSKQENQNRLYRYKSNLYRYKLAKNDQNRNCTGTSSTCTGTSLRKMPRMCVFRTCTGTSLRKVPRMCVFPIFHALSSMDHSYTSYTHQNHSKFTLESLFYSIPLSLLVFFQNLSINLSQYHSNMGYHPYTHQVPRFVRV